MKNKIYEAPAMEIVKLNTEDVVTVSNGDTLIDISGFFGEGNKWGNIF
jgi:hypothetical protein